LFGQAQLPEGFVQFKIAENLDPVSMAIAPDGRVFIAEKNGRILVIRDDEMMPDPFLEIDVDNYHERGLSGIAFHPDFEQNNFFYVFYTVPGANHNRISRFRANGDLAIPGSEEILLDMGNLAGPVHNGGEMRFGLDGKLYISTGDGADGFPPQSMSRLLGKFLRMNPDGSIPTDNPFYNTATGDNRLIYALGLRNSFTFDIQRTTGRIFANDVGQNLFEEVNEIESGKNYGWTLVEGFIGNQTPPDNYQDPIYAYDHDQGCAITGSAFYSPETYAFPPEYHDKYFFADYCDGYIKVLNPDNGQVERTFITNINRPIKMLVTATGEMYYLERAGMGGGSPQDNTSSDEGVLWKVIYTGSGAPLVASQPSDVLRVAGEEARFNVIATGSAPFTYQWQKDGVDLPGETASELILPNVQNADDDTRYRCIISNGDGSITSNEATLTVHPGTRPEIFFERPALGSTYRAGDTIYFKGYATDQEDGNIPTNQLRWWVDFRHDDHAHPTLAPVQGVDEGFVVVPRIGEISDNVFFKIYLEATDKDGLAKVASRDVLPEKVEVTITTNPPGLPINADGRRVVTPFTFTSVQGLQRTFQADQVIVTDDSTYIFNGWEGGNSNLFNTLFAPEEATTITANYDTQDLGRGFGLLGQYYRYDFDDPTDVEFAGDPLLVRIDEQIDFNWDVGEIAPEVGADNVVIRWTGYVEALHTGMHTFYLESDDGVRLWVKNEQLIDQWQPQPATETSGQIFLEKGQRVPIRIEYLEILINASVRLSWSNDVSSKRVVPSSQLYPDELFEEGETFEISAYPNPTSTDRVNVLIRSKHPEDAIISLYNMEGRELYHIPFEIPAGRIIHPIDVTNLAPGMYLVRVEGPSNIAAYVKFLKQ